MLQLIKGLYSQSEEDEHDKQIVYDTMYKTRWSLHVFQVLHTTLHCVEQFRKSVGLCQTFLQVPKGHSDKTITLSNTMV